MTAPNIVDSSGWIEYFLDSPRAGLFAQPIESRKQLIVPSVVIFEVCRVLDRKLPPDTADTCIEVMRLATVAPLDDRIAVRAARLGAQHKLAFGDAVIYATALAKGAKLWTQNADYEKLANVQYFAKPGADA
jgi:predicted nucleic acid-binding protein